MFIYISELSTIGQQPIYYNSMRCTQTCHIHRIFSNQSTGSWLHSHPISKPRLTNLSVMATVQADREICVVVPRCIKSPYISLLYLPDSLYLRSFNAVHISLQRNLIVYLNCGLSENVQKQYVIATCSFWPQTLTSLSKPDGAVIHFRIS